MTRFPVSAIRAIAGEGATVNGRRLAVSRVTDLVVAESRILSTEGMRFPDEFVRHKAVDAIGDLALAGAPLISAYRSVRGGHKLNHAVVSR